MNAHLTLSKASMVALLDALLLLSPEDSGELRTPWRQDDHVGPFLRLARYDYFKVSLNIQPLLSRPQLHSDLRRSALLARIVIDQAVAHFQIAEGCAGAEQMERRAETIRSDIREFVDDFCGIRPPRWPRPWPWPPTLVSAQLCPLDLLVAGAQFQKAANLANPLQADLSSAADQLFEAGLKRMENC
jgi:hypothetical protein